MKIFTNNLKKILLIMFMINFGGCLTTKVNDLVDNKRINEKLVKIKNATLTDINEIDIILIGEQIKNKKQIEYRIHLNLDTIIALYKNNNHTEEFDSKLELEKNGVNFIQFYKEKNVYYLVNLNRKKLLNHKDKNIYGKNISKKIKTNLFYKYVGFDNDNQIIITYFPENKNYDYIAFAIENDYKNNKLGYLLYPFAIVFDVITFPIQFIVVVYSFGKSLKP